MLDYSTALHSRKLNGKPRNAKAAQVEDVRLHMVVLDSVYPVPLDHRHLQVQLQLQALHTGINKSEETCPSAIVK
jgi:hypothetical protein